jgi:hypothetical protein
MATDVNLGMLSLEELRRLLGQTQAATPYSQVGVSPYQQIMGQMPLMQNPYANAAYGALGGYNPNMYTDAAAARMTARPNFGTGGGGGSDSGSSFNAAPSAWDGMTNAEKAAYYAENPNMAAITQFGQKAFGFTTPGFLQSFMNPGLVSEQSLIAMGVNPATYQGAKESFRSSEIAAMNAEAAAAANAAQNAQSMQSMQDALAADTAAAQAQSISDQSSAGSEAGGYGTGDTSGGFGEGQYNMGGPVDRVGGPNPPGPDDGTGMLQLGEYVIKKSAVNKYGTGLLDMINAGKIPAKKMKSLLG